MKGHAYAPDGYGMYGLNQGESGNAIGGYFKTNSTHGRAVFGEAVSGQTGYAGYFVGRGFFSNSVGIGTASPSSPLTVAGVIATQNVRTGLVSYGVHCLLKRPRIRL